MRLLNEKSQNQLKRQKRDGHPENHIKELTEDLIVEGWDGSNHLTTAEEKVLWEAFLDYQYYNVQPVDESAKNIMTTHIDNDKLKDMDDREDEKREDEQMLETGFSHWGPLNLNFGENRKYEQRIHTKFATDENTMNKITFIECLIASTILLILFLVSGYCTAEKIKRSSVVRMRDGRRSRDSILRDSVFRSSNGSDYWFLEGYKFEFFLVQRKKKVKKIHIKIEISSQLDYHMKRKIDYNCIQCLRYEFQSRFSFNFFHSYSLFDLHIRK